jgi:hypothetical protein
MESVTLEELDLLCLEYSKKRQALEALKAEVTEREKELYETEIKIQAYLEQSNKTKYSVDGIGTFNIVNRFTYKIPRTPEAKEKFFTYLKELNVYDDLINVNSQTLNAFCKEQLEKARDRQDFNFTVPGLEEPTLSKKVQLRRG